MSANPFALAIPAFLLLIGLEYIIAYYKGKQIYLFGDFVNNISTGIFEQLFSTLAKAATIYLYAVIASKYALFHISTYSIVNWLILFLLADFCYYWMHRSIHRCNFLWAGHSVHHQSEQYNLSVALRQGIIQSMFSWTFYLPIALLGFPVWMFALVSVSITLYQFWIHTTLINRLGVFEYLFNTPSHHRVHHGSNPQYIDKNYAGSLIIWDKLFGTFAKESEKVIYGVTEPLDSWDPYYANIKVLRDTWYYGQGLSNLKDKLLAFIMPPEWIVNRMGLKKFKSLQRHSLRSKTLAPSFASWFNLVLAMVTMTDFMFNFRYVTLNYYGAAIFVALTLYQLGHLVAGKMPIFTINLLRLLSIVPLCLNHNRLYISVFIVLIVNLLIDGFDKIKYKKLQNDLTAT